MSNIIEIKHLSFSYNKEKILNNINLEIKKGEFIGIMGPTGCGKSTFAFCLNGIIPQSIQGKFEGEVLIDGKNTKKFRVAEISQKVGLVFQDPDSQLFTLNVKDELAFGLENQGLRKKEIEFKVNQALKWIGIYHLKNRQTHTLSFGQKQKVCLASVLALDPEILVLDEPTAQLDYKDTQEVYHILKRINEKEKTIVIIEHKSKWLAKYASRILILNNGKFELNGNPKYIFNQKEYLEKVGIEIPN